MYKEGHLVNLEGSGKITVEMSNKDGIIAVRKDKGIG